MILVARCMVDLYHFIRQNFANPRENFILYNDHSIQYFNHDLTSHMCLAGAVANVADSDRCRRNPKVPSSIPAGGKDFP